MKTVLELLTDPDPSPRDTFIKLTAKAIMLRRPKTPSADGLACHLALLSAHRWGVFPVPGKGRAYSHLYNRLLDAVRLCRQFPW